MAVQGTTPLWVAAGILLQERADDFSARFKRTLKTLEHEDIHDFRVSSRRLREALTLFASCYATRRIDHLRKIVRAVTRLLGEMRNTDEALMFFTELAPELDADSRLIINDLIVRYRKRRQKDQEELKNGLNALDAQSLRAYFTKTLNAPCLYNPPVPGFDPFMPLSAYARTMLAERLNDVLSLVPDSRHEENVLAQHMLRIAVKRYRYRAEILSPLFNDGYAECHALIKNYQDILGTIHDLDVFAGLINRYGQVTENIVNAIKDRRHTLHRQFTDLLAAEPLQLIGERLENLL